MVETKKTVFWFVFFCLLYINRSISRGPTDVSYLFYPISLHPSNAEPTPLLLHHAAPPYLDK